MSAKFLERYSNKSKHTTVLRKKHETSSNPPVTVKKPQLWETNFMAFITDQRPQGQRKK